MIVLNDEDCVLFVTYFKDCVPLSWFLLLSSVDFFLSIGLGLGGTDTPQHKLRKSMSCERTFSATEDESALFQKLGKIDHKLFVSAC